MTDVEHEGVEHEGVEREAVSPEPPPQAAGPDRVPRGIHREWVKAKDAALSTGRERYRQEDLLDWGVARDSVLGDERQFLSTAADEVDRLLVVLRSERRRKASVLAATVFLIVGVALVPGFPWWTFVVILGGASVALISIPKFDFATFTLPSHARVMANPRWRLAQALKGVLDPEIDRWVDGLLRTPAGSVFVRGTLGLSELIDPSYEVPTQTTDLALRTLGSMRGASIGLAGVRGAGKSTLMRALTRGRFRADYWQFRTGDRLTYGTVVAAPVRYNNEDFIAHLFSSLCLNILGRDPDDSIWAQGAARWLTGIVAGGVLIAAGFAIRSSSHFGLGHTPARTLIAGAAWVLGAAAVVWSYPRLAMLFVRSPQSLARRNLHALRNLDTVSTTVSGLAGPLTANVSAGRTVASARRALALPDLVARYRGFVRVLAADRPVIIGIDELDKMESDVEARQFLNDIKTVFGQEHCYYLVSVSEDALSAFDRRGMPLRDVFDSSFDAVLRIGPLSAPESALLLSRRVVGLGAAAKLLCHVLSGGLPRDLIRAARDVADQSAAAEVKLTDILWPVAVTRVDVAHRAAATVAQRFVASDGTQPLLIWVSGLPPLADQDTAGLHDRWAVQDALSAVATSQLPAEDRHELTLVALQFAVLAFHTATVIDHVRALSDDDLEEINRVLEPGRPAHQEEPEPAVDDADVTHKPLVLTNFETLARARREMAVSPAVAWQTISGLRDDDEPFPAADRTTA
jgi:hypothetical protein